MANVHDVANFFIELGQAQAMSGSGHPVTHLQLQKLLYFAQGWHLPDLAGPCLMTISKRGRMALLYP